MNITRSEVESLFCPGDVVAVEYLNSGEIQAAIVMAEDGKASHALCCLGGLDIVEASVTGVQASSLRNYLKGNCRLTVRTTLTIPTPEQAQKATSFWKARINDKYDFGMILGMVPILFAKHILGFISVDLGNWALQKMPNLCASSNLSTCAELAAKGLREFDLVALYKYPVENVDPEILRLDPSLNTKAVLDAATFVD